jgi:deazaflavin-dependent oxidoreductase (nitroreductase family)
MSNTTAVANVAARILRNRRLVRAPVLIYQARLGALLTSRLLMLEHIGRKSGERRYAVLEVVAHLTPETFVIASGFGAKAQWFRNIQANPNVRVYVGSHAPASATARVLDRDEADRALDVYRAKRPRMWERFKAVLEETLGEPITDTNTPLPLVELRLDPR